MTVKLRVLTNSEMRVLRRCQREHFHMYVQGYRPIEDVESLRFGTAIHLGLEAWWKGHGLEAAITAATERAADPYEAAKLRVLLVGYDARWAGESYAVAAVEAEFRAPLVNPRTGAASRTYELGGKLDVLLERGLVEHKCLAGSSRVFDHATGRYWSLVELWQQYRAPRVTALAEDGKLVVADAKVPVAQPARPTVRVRTQEGRVLVASTNHPFFTTRGWVRAEDLTDADWVATPRRQASSHPGSDLPDAAFRLAGYMIGDGCLSNMSFCKRDENVLADVIACTEKLGDKILRRLDDPERAPSLHFSKIGAVAATLAQLGVAGGSAQKRAPQVAMSDGQVGQIIAGLWSTDGCVDAHGGAKPRLIYTSVSERLCRDVQELLQRLGIASSFNTSSVPYKGERRPVFTTKVVSRASKLRFVSLVREGVIPLRRSAVSLDDFVAAVPTSNQRCDATMQPRIDDHIRWDRVASVLSGPDEVLYDLEVPGPHTFVAEGIITHNTTSQEIGLGSTYWRKLVLDSQISTYYAGAKALGHEVDSCVYDVIRKPAIRPLRATPEDSRKFTKDGTLYATQRAEDETPEAYEARLTEEVALHPDRYYQRGEVVRLESEEREAQLDAWQLSRAMRESELAGRFPRNVDACERYTRLCPFFSVCSGTASLDDPARFRRVDSVHEELSGAA